MPCNPPSGAEEGGKKAREQREIRHINGWRIGSKKGERRMEQNEREREKTREELTQFFNILEKNSAIEVAISEYVQVLIIEILNRFLQKMKEMREKLFKR